MATQTAVPVAPIAPAIGSSTAVSAPVDSSQYPMTSLYVGDLHPNVTESMLYNKFVAAGPILSIRVCRDAITRRSLGYAYVNFQQPQDAERALDTMNFDLMQNRSIRIMWSQRDPTIRRSGAGNIFIKNLDPHIDTKSIYDTFSMFGSILSCKLAADEEGKSEGYGFIHFETEEAAQKAIEKVNGMLLDNKVVFVGKFQPRAARVRETGEATHHFNNVFVKNFADKLDDAKLRELFEKYGPISSCTAVKDSSTGASRGFGFVSFENPEDAERAVKELNGYELHDSDLKLTACRAQKKAEREAELSRIYEELKAERIHHYQGVNLYVKNLDDSVTSDELREHFQQHGVIASAKVMMDDSTPPQSKGFGFVCFEKPEDATKAVVEMNNRMLNGKPLYVALAQRKEDRKAQLASEYMQRMASLQIQNTGAMPVFTQGGNLQPQMGDMPVFAPPGNLQHWDGNAVCGEMPGYVVPQQANFGDSGVPRQQYQDPRQYYQTSRQTGIGASRQPQYQTGRPQQQVPQGHQYQAPRQVQQGHPQQIRREELISKLSSLSPPEQKQLLGEQLYPLVSKFASSDQVGKLVGMLLEIENEEILILLENSDYLASRVQEASHVLQKAKSADA